MITHFWGGGSSIGGGDTIQVSRKGDVQFRDKITINISKHGKYEEVLGGFKGDTIEGDIECVDIWYVILLVSTGHPPILV